LAAIVFWTSVGLILYTYAGYPTLLALVSRWRPPRKSGPARTPTVTLLVAAYNEEASIRRKLENCLSLDYPRELLQILVTADGSNDGTPEIVRGFADRGVELLHQPMRQGKMAAINRAMAHTRGEVVVFSDANNVYEPRTLRELVAPFGDPRVGGVTGSKVVLRGDGALGDSEGLYWRYESSIKQMESRLGSCVGAAGEVLAVRRSLYEAPPDGIINDDFYVAMLLTRRGYDVVYAPEARSLERVAPSPSDERTRRARIVAGRYQAMLHAPRLLSLKRPLVAWQAVSHKFMRPLVPWAMLGALVGNVAALGSTPPLSARSGLSLSGPFGVVSLCLQILFYLAAWLGTRHEPGGTIGKVLYLPTFLVSSNLAAISGLIHVIGGRDGSVWRRVPRREEGVELAVEKSRAGPRSDADQRSGAGEPGTRSMELK
jgi:cellulose synthase/poly-beta-1,6-N-acetylglucosamine synthase-like glycosyltransferase